MTASAPSAVSTWSRGVATLLPAVMPLAMNAVFRATTRRYGPERGYQAGFAIYWASCWVMAGTVVGPRRLLGLWEVPEQVLPTPRGLSAAVLLAPPLGGLATQWVPHARGSGPIAVAVAAGVGTTNALAEEVFWRGVPVAVFPDEPLRGWLWPAVGFTAWHLVPLTTRPSSLRRRAALLAGAASVGLGYGWIAMRTRSLALVAPAHAITDSSGVAQVRAIWLPDGSMPSRPPGSDDDDHEHDEEDEQEEEQEAQRRRRFCSSTRCWPRRGIVTQLDGSRTS